MTTNYCPYMKRDGCLIFQCRLDVHDSSQEHLWGPPREPPPPPGLIDVIDEDVARRIHEAFEDEELEKTETRLREEHDDQL